MIYTLFLACADFLINIIVNLLQHNQGSLIVTSIILRAICLSLLFPLIGGVVLVVLKDRRSTISLVVTTIVVYLLIPVIIYYLKSNQKSLWLVFVDLHLQFNLFVLILLPYIIASIICIYFSNELKLF